MFSNDSNPNNNGNGGELINNSSSDSDSCDSDNGSKEIVGAISLIKNNYRHPPLVANGNISVVAAAYNNDDSSGSSSSNEEYSSDDNQAAALPPPSKSNRMEAQLGLIFPVARTKRHLREVTGRSRISVVSGIGMAAALESVAEYILEQAELSLPIGPITKKRQRSKLLPKDLQMSCQNNETMTDIIGGTVIAYGGVLPNMPISLLGPRRKRKRKTVKRTAPAAKSRKKTKVK